MKIPISKLISAFFVSFVLLLAACTAPAEQNMPDNTQSQTQETPETEDQNNQQPQGGTEDEDVEESYKTYPAEEGWITYESTKNSLIFKYPIDFSIQNINKTFKREDFTENLIITINKDYGVENQEAYKNFIITISSIEKTDPNFENWFSQIQEKQPIYNPKCGEQKIDIETKEIDGKKTIFRNLTCPSPTEGHPGLFKQIFIEDENQVWYINTFMAEPYKNKWNTIFNKITNSIKINQ